MYVYIYICIMVTHNMIYRWYLLQSDLFADISALFRRTISNTYMPSITLDIMFGAVMMYALKYLICALFLSLFVVTKSERLLVYTGIFFMYYVCGDTLNLMMKRRGVTWVGGSGSSCMQGFCAKPGRLSSRPRPELNKLFASTPINIPRNWLRTVAYYGR